MFLKDTYNRITSKRIKIQEQPPIQEERIPLQNIPPSKANSPRPPSPKPQTIKKPQSEKYTKSKKQKIYEITDEIVHLKEKKDTRKKIKNVMNKKLLEQPQIPKPTIPLPNIEQPIQQNIEIQEEPPVQEPAQQQIIQQVPQELVLQSNNGHTGSFSTPQDIMPYGKKPRYPKKYRRRTKRYSRIPKFRKNKFHRTRTKRPNRKRSYDYQISFQKEEKLPVYSTGLLWSTINDGSAVDNKFTRLSESPEKYPEINRFNTAFIQFSVRKIKYHYTPNIVSKSDVYNYNIPDGNGGFNIMTDMKGFKSGFMVVDNRKLVDKSELTKSVLDIAKQKTSSVFSLDQPFDFSVRPVS